jgi:hypothetical protein
VRALRRLVPAVLLLRAVAPAAAFAKDRPAVEAIAMGSNQSPTAAVANLRYADDDAVQNARVLGLLGAHAALLTSPDAETRELFPEARPDAGATRDGLVKAIERAFDQLARAHAAGQATRFYFFFAGHGDSEDGRPFLQLDDGRLWRDDLAQLLRRSPADENHLVIDACQASLFVGGRGPGGERSPVAPGFSRARGPAWPAHTGLLTAQSAGGQTHEWTEFQGGIFSHEVRSGLLGGADADLDGKVSYRELAAFVARANEAIANRKYRPEVIAAAPGEDLNAVFVQLPDGPLTLQLDTPTGHAYVESERGVRVADLHPAPGSNLQLRLPTDLGALFVQRAVGADEIRIDGKPGHLRLSALEAHPARARARGAAHEAFLQLFSRAFDAASVSAFRAPIDLTAAGPEAAGSAAPRWLPWSVAGTGVAVGAAGLSFALSARSLARTSWDGNGMERQRLAPMIDSRNRAALWLGLSGAVLAAAGAVWALTREAP